MAKRTGLARRRKLLGHSQEHLAELLGVDRTTIVRWERGETDPQPWLRPKLAHHLGLTVEDLDLLLTMDTPSSGDGVRARVERLARDYDRVPSALLLAAAGQCHSQVVRLREQAHGSCWWSLEAESALLMGQLVWDVSQRTDHATTLTYLDAAITAAEQADDPVAEAHAWLRKSFVALYGFRRPDEGLALAQQAARTSRPRSPVLTGQALLHVAEAQAMRGVRSECDQALAAAEVMFGRISGDDPAIAAYSPTQFGRLAGSCQLYLGRSRHAEQILTPLAAGRARKSMGIVLGNLALACLRQRKIEEAVAVLHRAVDTVETTRGGGGLNVVFSVGRELRPWLGEPVVQEANDRLLALMTTP